MTRTWPRFVLRTHRRAWWQHWTWTLVAANGEPVLSSAAYATKGAALDGIALVRHLAIHASVVDETGDPDLPVLPEVGYIDETGGYGDDEEVSE